jgi:hypothetical protein
MMSFKYDLGAHLKDRVTGFDGVVIARSEFVHNCNRYMLQPRGLDKDGKPKGAEHFDEDQLELVTKKANAYIARADAPSFAPSHGGPAPAPQRRADPVRR